MKWINTQDKLPPIGERVLVEVGEMEDGYYVGLYWDGKKRNIDNLKPKVFIMERVMRPNSKTKYYWRGDMGGGQRVGGSHNGGSIMNWMPLPKPPGDN